MTFPSDLSSERNARPTSSHTQLAPTLTAQHVQAMVATAEMHSPEEAGIRILPALARSPWMQYLRCGTQLWQPWRPSQASCSSTARPWTQCTRRLGALQRTLHRVPPLAPGAWAWATTWAGHPSPPSPAFPGVLLMQCPHLVGLLAAFWLLNVTSKPGSLLGPPFVSPCRMPPGKRQTASNLVSRHQLVEPAREDAMFCKNK